MFCFHSPALIRQGFCMQVHVYGRIYFRIPFSWDKIFWCAVTCLKNYTVPLVKKVCGTLLYDTGRICPYWIIFLSGNTWQTVKEINIYTSKTQRRRTRSILSFRTVDTFLLSATAYITAFMYLLGLKSAYAVHSPHSRNWFGTDRAL
jgi:hypothetical protein